MKALILAAFIITLGLASCTVTEPNDGYSSRQRVYNNGYGYDSYASGYDNRYSTRLVFDYNTGRYYEVPVYDAPVYQDQTYRRRDNYRRDNYRTDDNRRDYYRETQPRYQQPQNNQTNVQPQEKRLPDGSRISPNGTITLPNGQVRTRQ